MNNFPLSLRDLVMLQEMCLELELRSNKRAAAAQERGDWARADRERRLKEGLARVQSRFGDRIQGKPESLPKAITPIA